MASHPGSSQPARPVVTLVTGATARAREQAIAAQLHQDGATAVILEGLADPGSILVPSATLLISRIAPGCLCCTGNLVLRVTLNRILRQPPARIFIGVASSEHLDQLRSWLQLAPYDQLLELAPPHT
ncbi:GTPase [Massilia horti]|uniref:GTPase n=1 Tax=Massilia horti TaxID=2562153 RepID=A0A4Y9SXN7_9BURK|nr:GTPase [Massilia horti]TFW29974.1 GTPase [Massilia horti]